MNLAIRDKRGIIVIDASGKLTIGESTGALRNMMTALLRSGHRRILLNMADIASIDSAGIGELVAARDSFERAGGQMKLLNLGKRVTGLLQITRLYLVFETFDDEAKALAAFPAATPSEIEIRYSRFFEGILSRTRSAGVSAGTSATPD